MIIIDIWNLFFGFLPAWFQIGILAVIALYAAIIAAKIVAFILDCIPFA